MSNLKEILEFKMYFRYILYIDYALQKIKRKILQSEQHKDKRQITEQDKNSILKYYFDETLNENKLGSATDMFLLQPYFKHLCYNSYDSTCNEYHKFINTLNKNNNQYNEKFADNLIQQFDDFSKKMHGLTLQEQQINQLKVILANAGANNIDSERFKEITEFIQAKLNNISQSKTNTQVNQLDEDIKKEEVTINARKEEMQEIEKYKLDLFEKEETNIQKKEKEITDNNKNIDTIEKELEKYNKPNLTTQEKEDKTKLEYQIADLQSKKEKLNKEKEESIIKKQDLQKDFNNTKRINDAERNQLENTLNGKKRKNEEEKDKLFFERGKVFFESLTSDLKTATKFLGIINDEELQDIKANPNKLINKINTDDTSNKFSEKNISTASLMDLEKMRSTLRYLKSTDLTDSNLAIVNKKIELIERRIKDITSGPSGSTGYDSDYNDDSKDLYMEFSDKPTNYKGETFDELTSNIWDFIIQLPVQNLLNSNKEKIIELGNNALEKDVTQDLKFRPFFHFKLQELYNLHKDQTNTDDRLQEILDNYEDAKIKSQKLEEKKRKEAFDAATQPIKAISKAASEQIVKGVNSTSNVAAQKIIEGVKHISEKVIEHPNLIYIRQLYDEFKKESTPPLQSGGVNDDKQTLEKNIYSMENDLNKLREELKDKLKEEDCEKIVSEDRGMPKYEDYETKEDLYLYTFKDDNSIKDIIHYNNDDGTKNKTFEKTYNEERNKLITKYKESKSLQEQVINKCIDFVDTLATIPNKIKIEELPRKISDTITIICSTIEDFRKKTIDSTVQTAKQEAEKIGTLFQETIQQQIKKLEDVVGEFSSNSQKILSEKLNLIKKSLSHFNSFINTNLNYFFTSIKHNFTYTKFITKTDETLNEIKDLYYKLDYYYDNKDTQYDKYRAQYDIIINKITILKNDLLENKTTAKYYNELYDNKFDFEKYEKKEEQFKDKFKSEINKHIELYREQHNKLVNPQDQQHVGGVKPEPGQYKNIKNFLDLLQQRAPKSHKDIMEDRNLMDKFKEKLTTYNIEINNDKEEPRFNPRHQKYIEFICEIVAFFIFVCYKVDTHNKYETFNQYITNLRDDKKQEQKPILNEDNNKFLQLFSSFPRPIHNDSKNYNINTSTKVTDYFFNDKLNNLCNIKDKFNYYNNFTNTSEEAAGTKAAEEAAKKAALPTTQPNEGNVGLPLDIELKNTSNASVPAEAPAPAEANAEANAPAPIEAPNNPTDLTLGRLFNDVGNKYETYEKLKNLKEITKENYDAYIENEERKLDSIEANRNKLSANQQLQEFVNTVKNNTYGDPIIPGVILGWTTINVVGDVLNGDQGGEVVGSWFDSLDGPLTIFGDGLAGISDIVNLPFMIVSHLFQSLHLFISPTGIGGFLVFKLLLFGVPKLINFMNGNGFDDPPSAEDILNEYVNQLQNINETNVNENKYFASMLVMMSYLPNLTKEKINVKELNEYATDIERIFRILLSKDQDEIIDLILDYYVISMSMINSLNGDITMQKKKILKNTALFYFLLSKDPNMPFNTIFNDEQLKTKLVKKFDNYILELTITTFSLMSGVTTKSDKDMIKKIVAINNQSESDDSFKDKMLRKYTLEQKSDEIVDLIIENIKKNLKYGSSKVIGLFKYYFTKSKDIRDKLLKGFFNQFHERIISKNLMSKIQSKFTTKIIETLDEQSILEKKEKKEMEETNSTLDIYSTQELLIQDLDKKDFFKESFEDGNNKMLLERIENYYDVIFKVFITYINNKIKDNNVEDIQLKSSKNGGEPFTDSMEIFRDNFLKNQANSTIYKSLIRILDYTPNIKLFKTIFRNKLFKYLTYFIYKLNLCSYNDKESIYYRIPQIFQKNITNKELDNYNLLNSFTINSVNNLTNEKDYQHNTHISLLNNKLTFLEKYGKHYKCYSGDSDKFVPLCKIKFDLETIKTIKSDLLIRNNHYVSQGIGKVVFGTQKKQEILDFLNYFTIIRFEIKDNKRFQKDEYYMLKLDSQQIGFNKLIKHVKIINEEVIKTAIEGKTKYVDLMFPNEYFQDYVNKKEKQKSYITEDIYKDYTIESQGSDRFKSIRKYTLKVSDEDSYGKLKQFKHVLSPFHFFEFDHNETSTKYYLQPKILDDVNLNEYFKQVYLEGGNTAKFQKDMAYNLGIGALTSAIFVISGPVGVAGIVGTAIATMVANETLKQTNMISESTATKVFMGTIFSAASAPITFDEWTEGIHDLIPDYPGYGGIPEEGKNASDILDGIENGDAKNPGDFFIDRDGEKFMVITNANGDKIEISQEDFDRLTNDEKIAIAFKFFEQAKANDQGFGDVFNQDDYHWDKVPNFMKSALKLARETDSDDLNHIDPQSLTDTFTSANDRTLIFPDSETSGAYTSGFNKIRGTGSSVSGTGILSITDSEFTDNKFKKLNDKEVIEIARKYFNEAAEKDEAGLPFMDKDWKYVPENMKRALKFAMDKREITEKELNDVFISNFSQEQSLKFPTFLSREDFGDKFSNFIESDQTKGESLITAEIGTKNLVDYRVDAIKEVKIKITSNIEDKINNQTTKQEVILQFEDINNNSIAINDASNIILNGEAISVNPVYIDDNNKKIMTITVESNNKENTLVVEEGAFAIIAEGLDFSKDQNGNIITNKNKVEYEWTKTNQTKGGQKSQIGGRNTDFSGFIGNVNLQEKYNKIASSVYTIDISNTKHHFDFFGNEKYFTNPSSVNITKVDKIMINLEKFLRITGSDDRVKQQRLFDIVSNQKTGNGVKGYWTGKGVGRMLPCIHKDIDSKNLITLFKEENAKFHGSGKDDKGGKNYINDFIEENTILKKNLVENDYYEYFTQLHIATKFNNDEDYILVFSNPHKDNQFRSDITINEINDNPLVLLNHENYDKENNEEKVYEELIIHLRNVYVNIKEKQGELLPGVIILKGLKKRNNKQKLIKIDDESSQKDLDKMYKEEKESYAKKGLFTLGTGAKVVGGALISHTLGSAIDCLPLVGTLTKTGITVASAALASEEDTKKVEEEYAKIESIFHRSNRFINTNLIQVKAPLNFEFRDKTSEILGGKKRKRPKTIKKYKYKKNKTGKRKGKKGKKTNNTPKLMNAKKSNKKMTISQILINNLKK